jgi:hypothetical protein
MPSAGEVGSGWVQGGSVTWREAAAGVPLPACFSSTRSTVQRFGPILPKPLRERPFVPDNRNTGRSGLFLLTCRRTGQGFGPGERGIRLLGTRRDRGGAVVTVAPWTLGEQPTCTPRVGPCARSVPSWAFLDRRGPSTGRAGVTMRRGGAPAHPTSTQQILGPDLESEQDGRQR